MFVSPRKASECSNELADNDATGTQWHSGESTCSWPADLHDLTRSWSKRMSAARERNMQYVSRPHALLIAAVISSAILGACRHRQDRNTKAAGSRLKKKFCRVIPVKQDPTNIFVELC